jgi:hypothetical protein
MSDGGGDAWFFAWTPDDYPARVISVPDGWDEIRERYSPRRKNAPLERLIEIATEHEVESVLIGEDADSPCRWIKGWSLSGDPAEFLQLAMDLIRNE